MSLVDAEAAIEAWRIDYNTVRPTARWLGVPRRSLRVTEGLAGDAGSPCTAPETQRPIRVADCGSRPDSPPSAMGYAARGRHSSVAGDATSARSTRNRLLY